MKALLYTDDPWCPSGVIGLFETEEQKQIILKGYEESIKQRQTEYLKTVKFPGWWQSQEWATREEAFKATIGKTIEQEVALLKEIEIPIGTYGEYY